MQQYLLFQLYSPLASWGGQAVGQERPSDDHPSRSALLGLLGAALGIARGDKQQQQALSDSCYFGMKVYGKGIPLRDFHTVQTTPANKKNQHLATRRDELNEAKLGTIISQRSYQQEQASVIALWLAPSAHYSLGQIKDALKQPRYHLYLGRKANPLAVPLKPSLLSGATLKEVFEEYDLAEELDKTSSVNYYWEQTAELKSGMNSCKSYSVKRYDQPLDRVRWQFSAREEQVYLAGSDH